MGIETMRRGLPMSKAKIVFAGAFVVFVVATIAIFIGFQSDDTLHTATNAKMQFDPAAVLSSAYPREDINESSVAEISTPKIDDAVNVSDFGRRLELIDERLASLEQSLSRLDAELSNHDNTDAEVSQDLATQLHTLKSRIATLDSADNVLVGELNRIKAFLQKVENEIRTDALSELPVAGLKLLSVSIWDDGAVAIVSLGNRKTGLSVGNFFAGLKVEDISVADQSLTLYEPARDKLYTLYADAIVYKEVQAQ